MNNRLPNFDIANDTDNKKRLSKHPSGPRGKLERSVPRMIHSRNWG